MGQKQYTTFLFFLFLMLIASSAFGAPAKVKNGLDILSEAPPWVAADKDTNLLISFDAPKMVPSFFPYASDNKAILEAALDYRAKHQLVDPKTNAAPPLSSSDLIKISKNLKGEFLLYLRFEPESLTNKGPWDNLQNPLTLNVTLVRSSTDEVLFQDSYLCAESADEVIDLGMRMGVHRTRPGDPNLRLSLPEAVKAGLRHASPELKAFLTNYYESL